MLPLPWIQETWDDYLDVLRRTHLLRVRVSMMTLDHMHLRDCSPMLLDGQVNIDTGSDDITTANLTLLDPAGDLGLDSPARALGTTLGADRLFQVTYCVSRTGQIWYSIPIFTGLCPHPVRSGHTLELALGSKVSLLRAPYVTGRTFAAGTKVTDAIRSILSECGETRMDIPDLPTRLGSALFLGWEDSPWQKAAWLAETVHRHLYYDGRGVCRLVDPGVHTMHIWNQTDLLSEPVARPPSGPVFNGVRVLGAQPAGSGARPVGYVELPREHPLSPEALARGGRPRMIVSQIEDQTATTTAACVARAREELRKVDAGAEVEFTALPMPHLEARDLVGVYRPGLGEAPFRLAKMTIPLSPGQASTVGYVQRVSNLAAVRRARTTRRG